MKESIVRFQDLLEAGQTYLAEADLALLRKAYVYATIAHRGQLRSSGAPYLSHPLAVTKILTELRMDVATLCGGLLHDVLEDCVVDESALQGHFGEEITGLVAGLTKSPGAVFRSDRRTKLESYRKMLLVMSGDIRIVIIKLADRLHNMRTLSSLPQERQKRIAEETLDIYAPLANRLGIAWIRSELEDLAFEVLDPEGFREIREAVEERVSAKAAGMAQISEALKGEMRKEGIPCEISGRIKHYYSIYRKLKRQEIPLDQVFDLVAIRVIVPEARNCYQVLGIVHALWTPIPARFKDYIAQPKVNGYRTLHTTVATPAGECVEIQIRTRSMHREAEQGVASHWIYKERGGFDQRDSKVFESLRNLLGSLQELSDPKRFSDALHLDLFPDQVYVLTPKGEAKELPRGSTPIDFAYKIHSQIGNHCVGAKVNGKIVPLRYELRNGDMIEILTAKSQTPKKDWLKFVRTPDARSRIRAWVRNQERIQAQDLGREILERGLRKQGLHLARMVQDGEFKPVLKALNLRSMEELLRAMAYGKVSLHQVTESLPKPPEEDAESAWDRDFEKLREKAEKRSETGVTVRGVQDMLVRFARCCNPVHGEEIVGFITRGRGVTIHARTCPKALERSEPERWIQAKWDAAADVLQRARIRVVSVDQPGLLAGISKSIAGADVNISNAAISTGDRQGVAHFEVMVRSLDHLREVMRSIEKVKGVLSVERLQH